VRGQDGVSTSRAQRLKLYVHVPAPAVAAPAEKVPPRTRLFFFESAWEDSFLEATAENEEDRGMSCRDAARGTVEGPGLDREEPSDVSVMVPPGW
jgi:hypothetical protein